MGNNHYALVGMQSPIEQYYWQGCRNNLSGVQLFERSGTPATLSLLWLTSGQGALPFGMALAAMSFTEPSKAAAVLQKERRNKQEAGWDYHLIASKNKTRVSIKTGKGRQHHTLLGFNQHATTIIGIAPGPTKPDNFLGHGPKHFWMRVMHAARPVEYIRSTQL